MSKHTNIDLRIDCSHCRGTGLAPDREVETADDAICCACGGSGSHVDEIAVDITARGVDVGLLRAQRDWLVKGAEYERTTENREGLINLLDHMLGEAQEDRPESEREFERRCEMKRDGEREQAQGDAQL